MLCSLFGPDRKSSVSMVRLPVGSVGSNVLTSSSVPMVVMGTASTFTFPAQVGLEAIAVLIRSVIVSM